MGGGVMISIFAEQSAAEQRPKSKSKNHRGFLRDPGADKPHSRI